jgi:hypothetical protein
MMEVMISFRASMGWSFVEHSNVTCLGFFLGYGED